MASEPLIVQALFAFKGSNNDELCFNKGDLITVTQKEDGGWWEGTLGEITGWFPSNYVREVKDIKILPTSHDAAYISIVYKDLVESERAHVAEQQGLVTNFLVPLERSTILSNDEYKQLIGNFLEVLDTHRELLMLIEDDYQKPHKDQRIGRHFINHAQKMKFVHQAYCSLHPKAVCILDKYRDELSKYMESCGANTPGVLVLTTGLSKPFRRLAKYSGMLLEVERHVECSHPDRGDIQRSVSVYKEIEATCAATRRQKELETQVLTGPVRGWEGQSLSTLGDILHMGSVAVGSQHLDRYLVLFPSTLLILSISHRLSAFIYEGKLPVTGITVTRLDDNEQYKNAFEITGPMIEKMTAVCQSRDEANHWVEILRKYNPNCTIPANNNKALPSQAEIVPQPPPHLNQRGYCTRTSVLIYKPEYDYTPTYPSQYYPPAAPYAALTKLYHHLVKQRVITKELLKLLLYNEYTRGYDRDNVRRRQHRTECFLMKDSSDEYSDSSDDETSSDSDDSDAEAKTESKICRQDAFDENDSDDSTNPFGYIRYYNPQSGGEVERFSDLQRARTKVVQPRDSKKPSIVLTSSVRLEFSNHPSEVSNVSIYVDDVDEVRTNSEISNASDNKSKKSSSSLSINVPDLRSGSGASTKSSSSVHIPYTELKSTSREVKSPSINSNTTSNLTSTLRKGMKEYSGSTSSLNSNKSANLSVSSVGAGSDKSSPGGNSSKSASVGTNSSNSSSRGNLNTSSVRTNSSSGQTDVAGGELNNAACRKSSVQTIHLSPVKPKLVQKLSEESNASSYITPNYAFENLPKLNGSFEMNANDLCVPGTYQPSTRQSCPNKLVADKFNESSLTTLYIPPYQSNSDNNLAWKMKGVQDAAWSGELNNSVDKQDFEGGVNSKWNAKGSNWSVKRVSSTTSNSSSGSGTTHSSSIDLPVNVMPLPDPLLAELLYNCDLIKPPSMFDEDGSISLAASNVGFRKHSLNSDKIYKRRSSIQLSSDLLEDGYRMLHQDLDCDGSWDCLKEREEQDDYAEEVGKKYCGCHRKKYCDCSFHSDGEKNFCECEHSHSPRSSDSGMAGSCTLNPADFPSHNQEDCAGERNAVSLMEPDAYNSQCRCTSPFGSTPRTSANVVTDSVRTSFSSADLPPVPPPWQSLSQIHSKISGLRVSSTLQQSKSMSALVEPKLEVCDDGVKTYRSGLYAHWWLKAKIPAGVVRGIYEETRRKKTDVGVNSDNAAKQQSQRRHN